MEVARAFALKAKRALDSGLRDTVAAVAGATGGAGKRVTYEDPTGRRFRVRSLLSDAGRFGQVYAADEMAGVGAEQRATGRVFAVKVVPLGADNRAEVQREAQALQRLRGHANVVRLEAAFNLQRGPAQSEAVFVMELCPGGSLFDAVADGQQPLAERSALAAFLDVCAGVAHMHGLSPPLAHRDIKLENVLLGSDRRWKLADFGSATTATALPTTEGERKRVAADIERNTTLCYRAPEMIDLFRRQLICEKVDVWALGCMLFKLAFLYDAFEEGALQILNNRPRFPKASPYSAALSELIRFMLVSDPAQRPDVGMVAARVAKMLGVPNPCSNFRPPDHSHDEPSKPAVSPSPSPPQRQQQQPHQIQQQQQPHPTKQKQPDFMTLLNWTTDPQQQSPAASSNSSGDSPPPLAPVASAVVRPSPKPQQPSEDLFAAWTESAPKGTAALPRPPSREASPTATATAAVTDAVATDAPVQHAAATVAPVVAAESFFDDVPWEPAVAVEPKQHTPTPTLSPALASALDWGSSSSPKAPNEDEAAPESSGTPAEEEAAR